MSTAARLRFLAIPLALLAAIVVVRNATVNALAKTDPADAARFWPGHPDVAIGEAMVAIGTASAAGAPVPSQVFDRLANAAVKAPLAPEPFIVHGIRSDLDGKGRSAEAAFAAALARDPRSVPARFFLAQHYLRANDMRGLQQVADLARLSPGGVGAIAPYLAAFAKQPAAAAPMRSIFATDPALRNAVLTTLAQDAANASLVLRLGGAGGDGGQAWIATLVQTLVAAGQFDQARLVWARAAGLDARLAEGLYDPAFSEPKAPAPFNWELVSSSTGIAERSSGRLHVIFYGERDGFLARQLVVLMPGRYRFAAVAKGSGIESLSWNARCASGRAVQPIASVPVARGRMDFVLPVGCRAVWLELDARSSDIGGDSDVLIGPAQLAKVGT